MTFEKFYNYKIYVDMDSVLCDFLNGFLDLNISNGLSYDKYKDIVGDEEIHKKVHDVGGIDFWAYLSWMSDGKILWDYVKKYNPTILSRPTEYNSSKIGKKLWIERELESNTPYIFEREKEKYATPESILIDDWDRNINKWIEAGGIGVLHTSTEDTIKQLKQLGY